MLVYEHTAAMGFKAGADVAEAYKIYVHAMLSPRQSHKTKACIVSPPVAYRAPLPIKRDTFWFKRVKQRLGKNTHALAVLLTRTSYPSTDVLTLHIERS
jgi:hypothetical protein